MARERVPTTPSPNHPERRCAMPRPQPFADRRAPQRSPRASADQPRPPGEARGQVDLGWTALRRFLILGDARGRYDAAHTAPRREDLALLGRCLRANGRRLVSEIVTVSEHGWAPRAGPALYALALAATRGDLTTRRDALEALPAVARTGEQLFEFVARIDELDGWGRSVRSALRRWY